MVYSGKEYQALFKTVLEDTGVPHPAVLKKPLPSPEDDIYYDGFCVLGSRRLWAQTGPQSIPFTEIVAYLDEAYVTDLDERHTFIEVVTHLDVVEMNHLITKARSK